MIKRSLVLPIVVAVAGCYGTPPSAQSDGSVSGAAGAAGEAGGGMAGGSGGVAGHSGVGGGSGAAGGPLDAGTMDAGCGLTKRVVDFEDLAFDGAFQALPIPYVHDAFVLTNSTQSLSTVGSKATQYLNTTAVIADPASTTTLTRSDGGPFALLKIDLSAYNDNHPGIVYSVTGTTPGGDAVETMISLLTMGRGFVTYPLPASFSNVVSVSWTMNSADNAQYFDNLSYSFCSSGD